VRIALNGATIMPATVEDDIDIAAECGYAALELRDARGRASMLDELRTRVAMARTLGAPSIVVVPGNSDAPPARAAAIGDAADALRQMSDVSGDVALAFEFEHRPRHRCVPLLRGRQHAR
jgi:sugar phosphate isomerase/epimerase